MLEAVTAQDDQNFYEKKKRLLRRMEARTATLAQKDWLKRWGFLENPKPMPLEPTYDSPTKTGAVYRYRGPMKVTPVAKLEEPRGPGTHMNSYGRPIASKKRQPGKL